MEPNTTEPAEITYEGDSPETPDWFLAVTLDDRPTPDEVALSEHIKNSGFGEDD